MIHICSRTLVDGAGGDETSLRVFTELVGQLEAQEAIALERLHVAELEGELKRVRLESHGWKAEAATAAEELQTLRLQLAASTRIRHAVPHPPPSASDGAAGGCSTSSAADGEPSSTERMEGSVGATPSLPELSAAALAASMKGAVQVSPSSARRLIEAVQAEKLVHEHVPAELRMAVQAQQRSLQAALALLAQDIYSNEARFVSELIQNADDCCFRTTGHRSFALVLDATTLRTHVNELGFTPRDVLALCDVGASTKAGVADLIGQKGIGFKVRLPRGRAG